MNESIFTKFRIPTLLGLTIIILGIVAGVYLTLQQQNIESQASVEEAPKSIVLTNLEASKVTISWQTENPVVGMVRYQTNANPEQTALDDRDKERPIARKIHYVTLKNLTPETTYSFKVISGRSVSQDDLAFTTAKQSDEQNDYQPIIGTVKQDQDFLKDGVVYLSIDGMYDQSAVVGEFGNFLIPISSAQTENLSKTFKPADEMIGSLRVISENGGVATATFSLGDSPIGTLLIGSNIDFNAESVSTSPTPNPTTESSTNYDFNGDQVLNATDYAVILDNLGRNPKDKRADLNNDGVVNEKDLEIMQQAIDKRTTR